MDLAPYATARDDVVRPPPGALSSRDVADLLRRRYAIITGGRCLGCPILTLPDPAVAPEPCWVSDDEYRQLVIYLTSVPVLEEADQGFILVIDRRQDRWSSVKAALLHIAAFFPGLITACYVLRPSSFLQRTWSDLSYKFSRDDFKFKVVICSSLDELHAHVSPDQLTEDLGGTVPYDHEQWIQQRLDLEKFSLRSQEISTALEQFLLRLQQTEFPHDVGTTENMLKSQVSRQHSGRCLGCPILTLPDPAVAPEPCWVSDDEYRQLVIYLTSVPVLEEADQGFILVIDRRQDRWSSVKAALLHIAAFFPGLITACYVLRPSSFLQRTWSDLSYKFSRDDFKFKVVICSSLDELHAHVSPDQLTEDLGGTVPYDHEQWIQQRLDLEKFSLRSQEISTALEQFLLRLQQTEFPHDVGTTENMLKSQGQAYAELKCDLMTSSEAGEALLADMRQSAVRSSTNVDYCPDKLINVTAVQRLLVQLEETVRRFENYWSSYEQRLLRWLQLRRFEHGFKECQTELEHLLKRLSDATDVGESVSHVDQLINEHTVVQKRCLETQRQADDLQSFGRDLQMSAGDLGSEGIEARCVELRRLGELVSDKLRRRTQLLHKCRDLHERVQRANTWCALGVELLTSQQIEKCSAAPELAERALAQIDEFLYSAADFNLHSPVELRSAFQDVITQETKALVQQVVQRIEDVRTMCDRRCNSLRKYTARRPVQTVNPEPAVPLDKVKLRSPRDARRSRRSAKENMCPAGLDEAESRDPEQLAARRQHILTELLDTEKTYVAELNQILKGYKDEMLKTELQQLIPIQLYGKSDVLFGNMSDIQRFHSSVFLRDLEQCIGAPEQVGRCFVDRREALHCLYSEYCQNKPASEDLRRQIGDANSFFIECQRRLQHKLPLGAFLLKPVQRITKYQLLLKDLLHCSEDPDCCKQLNEAVACMLDVLKCVNDSMHQVAISGFPGNILDLGRLLLQASHTVWIENKKDRLRELRLKPRQRHLFLYEKMVLFCKKKGGDRPRYSFKHCLKMSQVGLTETVKGDPRKFELWLPGRSEVHTVLAGSAEERENWVRQIKRVLMEQLEYLKGENMKQYRIQKGSSLSNNSTVMSPTAHKPLRQTSSWENSSEPAAARMASRGRIQSVDWSPQTSGVPDDGWSSEYSSDDDTYHDSAEYNRYSRFMVLADYQAVGLSEVSLREGDIVQLLKVGCAGWWYVRTPAEAAAEGWAPATYLERLSKRNSCGSPSVSSVESGGLEMRPAASRNSVASNLSAPSEADEEAK
ncbi:guanine nucleotide exchange factor DBS-like [Pollicipes pollicipes]|uniref:guanine nucleotide exchange factor DBS-like n=1 Tax=Pollicipes pollicipes TaxID=41117 RepID=UPI001884E956|nr:guanine nucleotide exchange factor DBS-like [Pollicipes pollicipes]